MTEDIIAIKYGDHDKKIGDCEIIESEPKPCHCLCHKGEKVDGCDGKTYCKVCYPEGMENAKHYIEIKG